MNITTFIFKEKPKCKTCGLEMKSWNPYAETHEHNECTTKRFGEEIETFFKKILGQNNKLH